MNVKLYHRPHIEVKSIEATSNNKPKGSIPNKVALSNSPRLDFVGLLSESRECISFLSNIYLGELHLIRFAVLSLNDFPDSLYLLVFVHCSHANFVLLLGVGTWNCRRRTCSSCNSLAVASGFRSLSQLGGNQTWSCRVPCTQSSRVVGVPAPQTCAAPPVCDFCECVQLHWRRIGLDIVNRSLYNHL